MRKEKKKQLYRIPEKAKVAGVCAGLAEYYGAENWFFRIVFVTGLVLSGSVFFIAYVALWLVLDEKYSGNAKDSRFDKQDTSRDDCSNNDIDSSVELKTRFWQSGQPAPRALKAIDKQFEQIEARVQKVESYVTSNEFKLKQEINKL